jgi:cell division protein FtsB
VQEEQCAELSQRRMEVERQIEKLRPQVMHAQLLQVCFD